MKIGLVLFGHLRSYRQTLNSFNLLKETLQRAGSVDIFCHTWDIEESVTPSWWKENKGNEPPPATVNSGQIEGAYQPVKFIIEPSRQFDDQGYHFNSSIPVAGILSMLHSQQRVFDLLLQHENENGFKYDLVIKTRYDLLYEIAISFESQLVSTISSDSVLLPSSNPYELLGSCSDIFAAGNRRAMENYFSFCGNFKKASEIYFNKGHKKLIPEFCMTVYMDEIGVKREILGGLRLHILRMNGDKFQINSDKNFTANMPLCFYHGTIKHGLEIAANGDFAIKSAERILVKKYMSWLDHSATDQQLSTYADFYQGKWVGLSIIKRLAAKGNGNSLFIEGVMKNFFEEAMRHARYGHVKKLILSLILYFRSGYGFFFFRVLKNLLFSKS